MLWRLLLILACAWSLSACGLFGGDEEQDPPAELVKFKSSLQIKRAWSAGIGDGTERLRLALTPATDGSRVFAAAHDGRVAAFEAVKGKRLWSVKTRLPLSAGPAVDGELVVLGSSNGDVIALDADTGGQLWRVSLSGEVLAPAGLAPRLVMVRTVDGKLIALRRDDGSEAWFVQQSVPRLSVRGTGSPVVAGELVICGFDNGRLAAYSLSDGSPVWDVMINPPSGRTEVDRLTDLNATVRVVGEDVYVAGYHGSVVSAAVESGQTLWAREISSYSGLATDFINLYVADQGSALYALSRRTGREAWRTDVLRNRDVTGPAAFRNSVVVGDFEGYLHWFNATTGGLEARVRAGSARISAAPVVLNDMVYVLNDDGKLYAFRDRAAE